MESVGTWLYSMETVAPDYTVWSLEVPNYSMESVGIWLYSMTTEGTWLYSMESVGTWPYSMTTKCTWIYSMESVDTWLYSMKSVGTWRRYLNIQYGTPNFAIKAEFGQAPIFTFICTQTIRYWHKVILI